MRGGDKLMEDVGGLPCLRVMADRAAHAGAHVIAALPDPDHPRSRALAGSGVQQVFVPTAHLGMSETLRAGIAEVPKATSGVMILPADMPDISAPDMEHLWQVFEREHPDVLRATSQEGRDGHPVIFDAKHLSLFDKISGDQGAMAALKASNLAILRAPLEGNRAVLDLDTPEDWAAWRVSCAR